MRGRLIDNLIRKDVEAHGWPQEERMLGPARCSPSCKRYHAYAFALKTKYGAWIWTHYRPCCPHERDNESRIKLLRKQRRQKGDRHGKKGTS